MKIRQTRLWKFTAQVRKPLPRVRSNTDNDRRGKAKIQRHGDRIAKNVKDIFPRIRTENEKRPNEIDARDLARSKIGHSNRPDRVSSVLHNTCRARCGTGSICRDGCRASSVHRARTTRCGTGSVYMLRRCRASFVHNARTARCGTGSVCMCRTSFRLKSIKRLSLIHI